MTQFLKGLSLPAVVAGFLAVLVSYSGPLAIFFQAGASAGISTEMMTSWVWAISMGAAVSGSFDAFVRAIPKGIAAGMMAGILFQFGVGAFTAIETTPMLALGMLACYVVFRRLVPKYTLVLLLIAGVVLAVVLEGASLSGVRWSIAVPQFIQPEWTFGSTLSLAIPLVLVSLTGQFLPGMAILQGAGYRVKAKPVISVTSLFTSLPAAFIAVLAGLALLGAISGNLFAALEDARHREASLIAFVVTASGMSLYGLSSAFWGVVIGYGCYLVLNSRSR